MADWNTTMDDWNTTMDDWNTTSVDWNIWFDHNDTNLTACQSTDSNITYVDPVVEFWQ